VKFKDNKKFSIFLGKNYLVRHFCHCAKSANFPDLPCEKVTTSSDLFIGAVSSAHAQCAHSLNCHEVGRFVQASGYGRDQAGIGFVSVVRRTWSGYNSVGGSVRPAVTGGSSAKHGL